MLQNKQFSNWNYGSCLHHFPGHNSFIHADKWRNNKDSRPDNWQTAANPQQNSNFEHRH
jgi:hypothetical protein